MLCSSIVFVTYSKDIKLLRDAVTIKGTGTEKVKMTQVKVSIFTVFLATVTLSDEVALSSLHLSSSISQTQ